MAGPFQEPVSEADLLLIDEELSQVLLAAPLNLDSTSLMSVHLTDIHLNLDAFEPGGDWYGKARRRMKDYAKDRKKKANELPFGLRLRLKQEGQVKLIDLATSPATRTHFGFWSMRDCVPWIFASSILRK